MLLISVIFHDVKINSKFQWPSCSCEYVYLTQLRTHDCSHATAAGKMCTYAATTHSCSRATAAELSGRDNIKLLL